MDIRPTKNAKDGSIFEIHEAAIEFLIRPQGDDVPCPWDADVSIEGGMVVLTGNLAPGGPAGVGVDECVCKVAIERFSKYYAVEVPEYLLKENAGLIDAIEDAGWEEVK